MVRLSQRPGEAQSADWLSDHATGAGVRVAIIDSGVNAGHPDLGGCLDADSSAAIAIGRSGELVVDEGPHDDLFGHGTACAGIVHEIAPDAQLASVRVIGPGLARRPEALVKGLGWAIEQRFDVINVSLGTPRPEWALALHELCDAAYFSGSLVVTAANNIAAASYPSLFASVVSVACNLSADPRRYHYNPDPPTEFLARGVDVEVAWTGHGRIVATGNSYAAPHISGLAALIKSSHPELRPFQIKAALWAAAANIREAPGEAAGRISRSALTAHALRT